MLGRTTQPQRFITHGIGVQDNSRMCLQAAAYLLDEAAVAALTNMIAARIEAAIITRLQRESKCSTSGCSEQLKAWIEHKLEMRSQVEELHEDTFVILLLHAHGLLAWKGEHWQCRTQSSVPLLSAVYTLNPSMRHTAKARKPQVLVVGIPLHHYLISRRKPSVGPHFHSLGYMSWCVPHMPLFFRQCSAFCPAIWLWQHYV